MSDENERAKKDFVEAVMRKQKRMVSRIPRRITTLNQPSASPVAGPSGASSSSAASSSADTSSGTRARLIAGAGSGGSSGGGSGATSEPTSGATSEASSVARRSVSADACVETGASSDARSPGSDTSSAASTHVRASSSAGASFCAGASGVQASTPEDSGAGTFNFPDTPGSSGQESSDGQAAHQIVRVGERGPRGGRRGWINYRYCFPRSVSGSPGDESESGSDSSQLNIPLPTTPYPPIPRPICCSFLENLSPPISEPQPRQLDLCGTDELLNFELDIPYGVGVFTPSNETLMLPPHPDDDRGSEYQLNYIPFENGYGPHETDEGENLANGHVDNNGNSETHVPDVAAAAAAPPRHSVSNNSWAGLPEHEGNVTLSDTTSVLSSNPGPSPPGNTPQESEGEAED